MGVDRAVADVGAGGAVDRVHHDRGAKALAGVDRDTDRAGIGRDIVGIGGANHDTTVGGDGAAGIVAAFGDPRIDRSRLGADGNRRRAGNAVARRHVRRHRCPRRGRRRHATTAETGQRGRCRRPQQADDPAEILLRRGRRIATRDRCADCDGDDVGTGTAVNAHRARRQVVADQRTAITQRIVGRDRRAGDRCRHKGFDLVDHRGHADRIAAADIDRDCAGRTANLRGVERGDLHRSGINGRRGGANRVGAVVAMTDLRHDRIVDGVVNNRAVAGDAAGSTADADGDADDLRAIERRDVHHATSGGHARAVDQREMGRADPVDQDRDPDIGLADLHIAGHRDDRRASRARRRQIAGREIDTGIVGGDKAAIR